jgi:hypothetical protein
VISEPPSGDRWAPELLEELGVERSHASSSDDRVARFIRRANVPRET